MNLSANDITGRTIVGAGGDVIGELANVCVDTESWRVDSVRVTLRKEVADRLGAERSLFQAGSVQIPVSLIQSVGDAVVLSVSVSGLSEALFSDAGSNPRA